MICPKCRKSQPSSDECISCGIIIKKYKQKTLNSSDSIPKTSDTPSVPRGTLKENDNFWIKFKRFRIAILSLTLLIVAVNAYGIDRRFSTWETTLNVVIYPINADNGSEVEEYIDSLEKTDFVPIENFMREEAALCELILEKPVAIHLAP
jgi:hypothetical protein